MNDSFWIDNWHHCAPREQDGRYEIIVRLCFAPLETEIYGSENGKLFREYHYIEGLRAGEKEFSYIELDEFRREVKREIALCEENDAYNLADELRQILDNYS